jgi:L-iditol 2-dehydrogenase
MKALTLIAPSTFEFGDAPQPRPGVNEVLVKVHACGICGSDLHGMDGRSGRRIPPIIMGHEAAGEVVELGEGVQDWKVGDRVTFDSTEYDANSPDTAAGFLNLSEGRKVLGVSCGDYRRHGCFAEYVVLPQHILYAIPEDLGYEKAAFAEPVAIALHAVNLAPTPNEGATAPVLRQQCAVVVGAGLIGLLVVQALKARGWQRVFAVDLDDGRLALAKNLGAEEVFNAKEEGVLAKLKALGGGDGVDAAFEVVGAAAPVELAIKSVRRGGTVVLVGNLQPNVGMPLQDVVTRQLTLKGSCACAGEYPEAIERIQDGSIDVQPLLSVVAPLSEGADWFHKATQPGNGLLKVVLTPA